MAQAISVGLIQARTNHLRLLVQFTDEKKVKELNDTICDFFVKKVGEKWIDCRIRTIGVKKKNDKVLDEHRKDLYDEQST